MGPWLEHVAPTIPVDGCNLDDGLRWPERRLGVQIRYSRRLAPYDRR